MTDFLSLDEQTRAYALVGSFLQAWSLMEQELDLTLAEALGIYPLVGSILCKSIQFSNKIQILRGLLPISALDDNEKLRIDQMLEKLGEFSRYRNVVAHDPFIASDDSDGVVFVLRRPKGKRRYPIDDWSVAKFAQVDEDIGSYSNELEALRKNLKISRAVIKEWAASLYADNPLSPTGGGS